MDLQIACRCGQLQGTIKQVTPATINRVICYCKFCQAYAQRFDQSASLLDAQGGSELIQPSPARVTITQGVDHLACVKQTEKGALRYYAQCCHTPLFNSMQTPTIPFISVLVSALPQLAEEPKRLPVLGPVRMHVSLPDAQKTNVPQASRFRNTIGLLHFARLTLGWMLRGDAKRSPIWTQSGHPIASVRKLARDDKL